jgi:hypothetical protein
VPVRWLCCIWSMVGHAEAVPAEGSEWPPRKSACSGRAHSRCNSALASPCRREGRPSSSPATTRTPSRLTSTRHAPPSGRGAHGRRRRRVRRREPEGRTTSHRLALDCPRPQCCWSGPMWQGQDSNLCRQRRRFYRSHRRLLAGPVASPRGPGNRP